MKLIVHAGPHKTGTTFIQDSFANNRSDLLKSGWAYPIAGTYGSTGHHHLAHNFVEYIEADGADNRALRAEAQDIRENHLNMVLSAEGFCRWAPRKYIALAEVVGANSIEVIYTVRDPMTVFHSYWGEEVKQGFTASFADRFLESLCTPITDRVLNPMQDIAPLLRSPEIDLHAVPYDELARRDENLFLHLLSAVLRIKDVPPSTNSKANSSLPIELTELLRLANLIHGEGAPRTSPDLRLAFMGTTSRDERKSLTDLVREDAARARRQIVVPADDIHTKRMETILESRLDGYWTRPLAPEGLFPLLDRNLTYYDTFFLWQTPSVRQAAEAIVNRCAAT
ncbi:hypothetical protein [Pseudophaeobacter sp.]|uniref:hypothetical protein n=1 Tax=Pseudophaeobacter sp. TaxID=1971739 RepID=UPI003296B34E